MGPFWEQVKHVKVEEGMKASVDADICTGCGLCCDMCPEVFEMGDSVARVRVSDVPDSATASCREAAEACPVEAIRITT